MSGLVEWAKIYHLINKPAAIDLLEDDKVRPRADRGLAYDEGTDAPVLQLDNEDRILFAGNKGEPGRLHQEVWVEFTSVGSAREHCSFGDFHLDSWACVMQISLQSTYRDSTFFVAPVTPHHIQVGYG